MLSAQQPPTADQRQSAAARLRQQAAEEARKPAVAVIGSGVAGLTAAYVLRHQYRVTLYEADDRFGGHSHTHELAAADGRSVFVDSGFIVHNERTYPNLIRLFAELGVTTRPTQMSMSVRCEGCGLEYAGARGPRGVFAQPGAALRPRYLKMLGEVRRFHTMARRLLAETQTAAAAQAGPPPGAPGDETVGGFLRRGGFSAYFTDHFVVPLISAVWSSGTALSMRYPARYLFAFLDHHGMLSVTGSPTWRTVEGGSRTYVDLILKELPATLMSTPVRAVHRHEGGVIVRDESDEQHEFDRVVIATHSDQALDLLADPTPLERELLGALPYETNETILHTDSSVLPEAPGAWASWNYLLPQCRRSGGDPFAAGSKALVSYHMNRLQGLTEPMDYLVSLNCPDRIDPQAVLARMTYHHPVYTPESLAARARLPELAGPRTAFAGAYHGWGFHEDGCASGVRAAAEFGAIW
ncbi:MAG TPA: FAD-dependent oxidoreductase [Actinocrinis sp.]|nr:FAD-dependent oxidoreductase [Actinocrinis sp.]